MKQDITHVFWSVVAIGHSPNTDGRFLNTDGEGETELRSGSHLHRELAVDEVRIAHELHPALEPNQLGA